MNTDLHFLSRQLHELGLYKSKMKGNTLLAGSPLKFLYSVWRRIHLAVNTKTVVQGSFNIQTKICISLSRSFFKGLEIKAPKD